MNLLFKGREWFREFKEQDHEHGEILEEFEDEEEPEEESNENYYTPITIP